MSSVSCKETEYSNPLWINKVSVIKQHIIISTTLIPLIRKRQENKEKYWEKTFLQTHRKFKLKELIHTSDWEGLTGRGVRILWRIRKYTGDGYGIGIMCMISQF